MSTMKKRIPMFLLALAMMVAMAVPAFAASYRPNAQFGYLLNINGSTGSAYQGRALNLMKTDTMGTDQNFIKSKFIRDLIAIRPAQVKH